MYTVTVLAAPDPRRSDPRTASRPCAICWAASIIWLDDRSPPNSHRRPARRCRRHRRGHPLAGFDLVIQPTEGRRKAVLLADMDSTMIEQECIDELADMAGVGPRVAEITARAMNGELNFHEALIERVGLLAGLDERMIQQVLDERITMAPGGQALVATMRAQGAYYGAGVGRLHRLHQPHRGQGSGL
jgi:phosphoserine phosphatase